MAARLDAEATTTVVIWTLVGLGVGAAMFAVAGLALGNLGLGALVGLVAGGVVGYLVGEHRALMIRFEAQLALCLLAIEGNTRSRAPDEPSQPVSSLAPPGGATRAQVPEQPGEPMTMPAGDWNLVESSGVSGRYEVMSGDERETMIRNVMRTTVVLDKRFGGVWLQSPSEMGFLLDDDGYRWAVSHDQPDMLLVLTGSGEPKMLLRRTS